MLISTKCMPILLYGLEAFSLYNYQMAELFVRATPTDILFDGAQLDRLAGKNVHR